MAILVNGEYVDDTQIRLEADLVRANLAKDSDLDEISIGLQAWEWAKESVISKCLLRQAASAGAKPPKVARPTNKEIGEYYRRHRDSFYAPEMIHAAHIVKNIDELVSGAEKTNEADALAAITAIANELQAGRNFEEAADEHSDCPGRGGDLGWFPRGEMVEEFDAVVFAMRVGETSVVFRSPFGFHIAKLLDRRPEGIRALNDVREAIEEAIYRQRTEEAMLRFVDGLRANAEIEKVARRDSQPG
jgi:parvulin-like peptidyl-prolyl isomerase